MTAPLPRGWSSNLLDGLAAWLAGRGVGVWRPDGVYTAAETAIVLAAMPLAPDRVVCLTLYPVADRERVDTDDVLTGLQVRTRAGKDPRDVDDLADAVYDLIHGVEHVTWGGVWVNQARRQSGVRLGRDSSDRWERSDNYYVDAARPTAARPQ